MMRFALAAGAVVVWVFVSSARAQSIYDATPIQAIASGDLAATDALGRSLPTAAEVGPPKKDRWVGLFFWQWHGDERWWGDNYDVTKYLETHPRQTKFPVKPEGGPNHPTWYWGEPIWGYYRASDPWVMRRQLPLIAAAGVDFIFLDYTNSNVYDDELTSFVGVWRDLKKQGVAVPRIVFFLNHQPEWKTHHLYTKWYADKANDDLWFKWRGKPLILTTSLASDGAGLREGQDKSLVPAINKYFTFRPTWALFKQEKEPTKWRFIHQFDPPPALDPEGRPEQVVVCKSMGGPLNNNEKTGGVSAVKDVPRKLADYDDQWLLPDVDQGVHFAGEWRSAEKNNVPIVLVTGWNEWKASVWNNKGVPWFGTPVNDDGNGYFVDEFNRQFNRDLEPMNGYQTDTYYQQFVQEMRRYKGLTPPAKPSPAKTIAIDGKFDDWADVTPVFRDPTGDTAPRDWAATMKQNHYTNNTGRNDLATVQVARDATNIYIHVTTAEKLSPTTDPRWMNIYLDTDQNSKSGWMGYDVRVNEPHTANTSSVQKWADGKWVDVTTVPLATGEKELEVSLPRHLLGFDAGKAVKFDLKVLDNSPASPDVVSFYTAGDAAPDGRFNFRFED